MTTELCIQSFCCLVGSGTPGQLVFLEVAHVLCDALPSKGSAAASYLEISSGREVEGVWVLVLNSMDFPAASHG